MESLLEVYNNHKTAKALKSPLKGLKLLKLSRSWTETKNNNFDWQKIYGMQTNKHVQHDRTIGEWILKLKGDNQEYSWKFNFFSLEQNSEDKDEAEHKALECSTSSTVKVQNSAGRNNMLMKPSKVVNK